MGRANDTMVPLNSSQKLDRTSFQQKDGQGNGPTDYKDYLKSLAKRASGHNIGKQ